MILHWDQLGLHYGHALLNNHRSQFAEAHQTTYGLLCCRYSPTEDPLGYSAGMHAEERLLQSAMWQRHIPQALRHWTPHDSPVIVTLALNRSPCRRCVEHLIRALAALYRQRPAGLANRFILVAKGAYEDAEGRQSTTQRDLFRLKNAGWELGVLQVGPTLSARGRILLEGIQRLSGSGLIRLDRP